MKAGQPASVDGQPPRSAADSVDLRLSPVRIVDHPLAKHHLTILREKSTAPGEFRRSLATLTVMVGQAATGDLALSDQTVETPIERCIGSRLAGRIGLVPILRAGLGMVEPMAELIPTAEVWHLGLYRDEQTAMPVHYYSKLPPDLPVDVALILDPMLATGGSAAMACQSLTRWGVRRIKLLSVIAAPEGIARLAGEYPGVEIYTCAVDKRLDEHKFIVPGLGDAGDRIFNTLG